MWRAEEWGSIMRPITQIHMSITRFNMALTIIKQMQEGSHRQTVPRWRVMGAERDAESTFVFYLRSCHHIAISSFQSYLELPETVLQPSLTQSLQLTCCYFISVPIFFFLFIYIFFRRSALATLRPHARAMSPLVSQEAQRLQPDISHSDNQSAVPLSVSGPICLPPACTLLE